MSGATGASAIRPEPCAVSVVIPTLNGGARFCALLEALAGQDLEGGFQLVVVDSGSGDGTAEAAETAGAKLLRIPREQFNHGATRNLGIAASSGERIALLTQDALPLDESYLRLLLDPFANPRIDGVYARQFPRRDCDPLLSERLRRWSAARSERELKVFAPADAARSREIFASLPPLERYLSCAFDNVASSLRRTSWERVPLPERSFGEDVAWAREILLGGGSIAFEPAARVEHSHRIRMGREFRRIYCDHRNLNELFGLVNVPSWAEVFRGWRHQRRFYAELLAGLELEAAERLGWRAYAMPYALLETAAQFLGARSLWKCDQSRFWAWADRRIRAGV